MSVLITVRHRQACLVAPPFLTCLLAFQRRDSLISALSIPLIATTYKMEARTEPKRCATANSTIEVASIRHAEASWRNAITSLGRCDRSRLANRPSPRRWGRPTRATARSQSEGPIARVNIYWGCDLRFKLCSAFTRFPAVYSTRQVKHIAKYLRFEPLSADGRLTAITSEGPLFRQGEAPIAFAVSTHFAVK